MSNEHQFEVRVFATNGEVRGRAYLGAPGAYFFQLTGDGPHEAKGHFSSLEQATAALLGVLRRRG